jgi:hypothetical protein
MATVVSAIDVEKGQTLTSSMKKNDHEKEKFNPRKHKQVINIQ